MGMLSREQGFHGWIYLCVSFSYYVVYRYNVRCCRVVNMDLFGCLVVTLSHGQNIVVGDARQVFGVLHAVCIGHTSEYINASLVVWRVSCNYAGRGGDVGMTYLGQLCKCHVVGGKRIRVYGSVQ